MNKKFIASVLTVSMLMGLSVPAMAGDNGSVQWDENSFSFTVSGGSIINEPTIQITYPTDDNFVINPFKNGLKEETVEKLSQLSEHEISGSTVSGQVAGVVHEVQNNGDVDVAIDITSFTADPDGALGVYNTTKKGYPITIASAAPKGKDWTKTKTAYIYLQFATDEESLKNEDKKNIAKAVQLRGKNGDKIDPAKKGGKKLKAMEIKKDGGKAYYQLKGAVNATPKALGGKAGEQDVWTAADKINVSYKVVITPQVN